MRNNKKIKHNIRAIFIWMVVLTIGIVCLWLSASKFAGIYCYVQLNERINAINVEAYQYGWNDWRTENVEAEKERLEEEAENNSVIRWCLSAKEDVGTSKVRNEMIVCMGITFIVGCYLSFISGKYIVKIVLHTIPTKKKAKKTLETRREEVCTAEI